MANSVDPDQTAPIGAVCSGSKLFASILNLSVMSGNCLQQTTSADDIFRCIFFLALSGLINCWPKRYGPQCEKTLSSGFPTRYTKTSLLGYLESS